MFFFVGKIYLGLLKQLMEVGLNIHNPLFSSLHAFHLMKNHLSYKSTKLGLVTNFRLESTQLIRCLTVICAILPAGQKEHALLDAGAFWNERMMSWKRKSVPLLMRTQQRV